MINHNLWVSHTRVTTRCGTLAPLRPRCKYRHHGVFGVSGRTGNHSCCPTVSPDWASSFTWRIWAIVDRGSAWGSAEDAICHSVSPGWTTCWVQPAGAPAGEAIALMAPKAPRTKAISAISSTRLMRPRRVRRTGVVIDGGVVEVMPGLPFVVSNLCSIEHMSTIPRIAGDTPISIEHMFGFRLPGV